MSHFPKLRITSLQLVLIMSLYFATIGNFALWRFVSGLVTPHDFHSFLFVLSLPLTLFLLLDLFFSLFAWPYLRKPVFILLTLISAGCAYFMVNYNVVIDRGMVQNLFETNYAELSSYFSWSLFLFIAVTALIPVLFLLWVRFKPTPNITTCVDAWSTNLLFSFFILIFIALSFYKDYSSLLRNNRVITDMTLPVNYIRATYSYARHYNDSEQLYPTAIGEDAVRVIPTSANARPKLLVIVVGETARSKNFSLNGYDRLTNPFLSQRQDIISFQNVSSCGTATAISLPCLFSRMSRRTYNEAEAKKEENLLDILQRTGIDLYWRNNNNGGCKGVCNRIAYDDMPKTKNKTFCKNIDGTCYDDILLSGLDEKIQNMNGDAVIILHQLGSHGPTYFARYEPPRVSRRLHLLREWSL